MIIVEYLGVDIKEYMQIYLPLLQGGEGCEHLVPRICPSCKRKKPMHRHEYKSRQVVVPQGRYEIEVLRMYCPGSKCGSTHTLLPHFVLPYHTYGAQAIMVALRLYAQSGSYHLVRRLISILGNRTVIRQWVVRFSKVVPELLKGLERFLMQVSGFVPPRWRQHRSAKDPPLKGILKAFTLAATHAAGFLSKQLQQAVLPDGVDDLLGWTHLLLHKTDHLVV